MSTTFTADDIYQDASARVAEMIEGEEQRHGCLQRAVFAVIRRVPDLSESAIHKLRRGYDYQIKPHAWVNLVRAHQSWLEDFGRHLNERQKWIEGRQAELHSLIYETNDQAFYQGRTPELDHSSPAHHRLADQKDKGA